MPVRRTGARTLTAPAPKGGPARTKAQTRIALRAFAAGRLPPGAGDASLPRLRLDRVARRLVRSLQAGLCQGVPKNRALVITVSAPIRLPARTVSEVQARLAAPFAGAFSRIVCGNRVRAQMVGCRVPGAPRVIVFVHNRQPSARGLPGLVEAWLAH